MTRPAVHAARGWYPGTPERLAGFMASACVSDQPSEPTVAIISPHAGYRYSGHVAGAAYARAEVPGTVVVVGIGHRYARRPNTIGVSGAWEIPGATVPIDGDLAAALLAAAPALEAEDGEQLDEHSLEIQVPFLHHRNPEVRIVPIQVRQLDATGCVELGEQLASVLKTRPERTLLVASTDLHHQERLPGVDPAEVVPRLDALAIDRVTAFDPEGLYRTVRAEGITMCGVIPTTVVLSAARALGATTVEAVQHATSFDVTGERGYVVGYLSALVS